MTKIKICDLKRKTYFSKKGRVSCAPKAVYSYHTGHCTIKYFTNVFDSKFFDKIHKLDSKTLNKNFKDVNTIFKKTFAHFLTQSFTVQFVTFLSIGSIIRALCI